MHRFKITHVGSVWVRTATTAICHTRSVDPTTRYVHSPGTVSRTTAERVYLYRQEWDEIMVLEGLGPWIWHCLAEPVSVEELAEDVATVLGDSTIGAGRLSPIFAELAANEALTAS